MQPYFFPYIGYFQLIHAVDAFVVFDDVSFIKGGWINRNYILSQEKKLRITCQLLGASSNLPINQINVGNNREILLKTIQQSYAKAPYCNDVMPLIKKILSNHETNLALYLSFSLNQLCEYLGLKQEWYFSSEIDQCRELYGQQRVLSICKFLKANHYINASGGKELYECASFTKNGIKLSFLRPEIKPYFQKNKAFVPNLSIIDVMMFNNKKQCQEMVNKYVLD